MQGHLNVLGALWITGDRPSESATPIPVRAMAGVRRAGWGLASRRGGFPLLQSGLALEQLNGQEGPRKEKKK